MIEIRDAEPFGDFLESAIAAVPIEAILRSFLAVGHVDIGVPVGIGVDDGDGGTHRSHLRHDVRQLGIERRRFMNEGDAGRSRHFGELESVALACVTGGGR